ncbi:unnamed protein product [Durusdinium trenchii]|uniref:TBC1 domain family member 31 n=1 Tax=Durusdinium trenchii TaxID=1381693 RepID=A0ABP0KEY8_9DINO
MSTGEAPSLRRQVLLLRHGQSRHNAAAQRDTGARDPLLSELGLAQAARLRGMPIFADCELLVVSPLSRALQTAAAAFGERPEGTRVVLSPLHSERWCSISDEGRSKSELLQLFPFIASWEGFAELPDDWTPRGDDTETWRSTRVPAFLVPRPEPGRRASGQTPEGIELYGTNFTLLMESPCEPCEQLPTLQRIALQGETAAAVDCHGGLYIFDLKRRERVRLWQEAPFSGALCFVRAGELLFSVQHKVRVLDAQSLHRRPLRTTLLQHQEPVTFAAASENWATTLSRDRLLLWEVGSWTLHRRIVASHLVAANLTSDGQQVGALYHDVQGHLRWSLWSTPAASLVAEAMVPRLDDVPPSCLAQLAIGDTVVGVAARKREEYYVLVWPARLSPAVERVQMSKPMTQLVAHGHELFVLCRDEVLALSPQSSSVRRIPWPHCKLLALDGAVVRHRRTVALLQRAGGAGSVPVQRLEVKELTLRSKASSARPRRPRTCPARPRPLNQPDVSTRLAAFLQRHGTFGARSGPASLRASRGRCWQKLLRLPNHAEAYEKLKSLKLEDHELDALAELPKPRKATKRVFQKLLGWCPSLRPNQSQKQLPEAALAAAQLGGLVLSSDLVGSFELAAAVLQNWPPSLEDDPEAFQRATQVLRTRDLELVTHLEILAGDLPVLLQPMVSCLLSRSLPRSSWLVLWDHLIVAWQQPQLLLPAALAVLRSKRQLLLHLESFQRVRDLILSPTRTDTARLLSEFYALWEASGACPWGAGQSFEAAEDYAPLSLAARPSPPETSDAAPVPVCSNSPVPEQVAEPSDGEDSEFLRALEQLESGGPEVEVVIDLDPKQAEDFLLFRQQIHRASVPEVAPNAEGEVGERWPTPQKMGMDCSLDTTALEIPEMWSDSLEVA